MRRTRWRRRAWLGASQGATSDGGAPSLDLLGGEPDGGRDNGGEAPPAASGGNSVPASEGGRRSRGSRGSKASLLLAGLQTRSRGGDRALCPLLQFSKEMRNKILILLVPLPKTFAAMVFDYS